MVEREPEPASGEDRLIARYFRPLATDPGALGLRDDAATITPPPGSDVVLKTDAVVAGVHFFPDDSPGMIAKKALRVNLSDLAAKGASPAGFLLSLVLPKTVGEDWLAAFAAGLGEDARDLSLPPPRRRYRPHAGPGDHIDRGFRNSAGRHHGSPQRRAAGRPGRRHRHDR